MSLKKYLYEILNNLNIQASNLLNENLENDYYKNEYDKVKSKIDLIQNIIKLCEKRGRF